MTFRPHIDDGSPCWCEPEPYQLCPECDGSADGCPYCRGYGPVGVNGLVPAQTEAFDIPTIWVHRDTIDGPEDRAKFVAACEWSREDIKMELGL